MKLSEIEQAAASVCLFSPFTTTVQPAVVDPRKVSVAGIGIRPEGVPASLPISFKVDTREAGQSNLDVVVQVGCVHCVAMITQ